MDEQTFLTIQSANKAELVPYLKSKDFMIRKWAKERLRQLDKCIFSLEEVV